MSAPLTIGFVHPAYQLGAEFAARGYPARSFEVRTFDDLKSRIAEADVLVLSGLWRNDLIDLAPKLRFVQSVSAGTDQFDRGRLARARIRLASAQGANERAVAEHAMALILALSRQLHLARDHQTSRHRRPMIGGPLRREDELEGKTLVIVGLGRIGTRLAGLACAFGMSVIGVRRHPAPSSFADEVIGMSGLREALGRADILALTCPLTPETEGLFGETLLAALPSSAWLINVARGRVVDEAALIEALRQGRLAGAGLDCFHEEPLSPGSPLWSLPSAIITPHNAGETRRYEANVVDILIENLQRLDQGASLLHNEITRTKTNPRKENPRATRIVVRRPPR